MKNKDVVILICFLVLLMSSKNVVNAQGFNNSKNEINSKVDVNKVGSRFDHFWSKCVGAGRANEGLRISWFEQLKLAKDNCGFEYCRFHGLFHEDMFVYKEVEGKPIYNWQYIDDLFDRMLSIDVKPFVELGFMPAVLASGERTQFWWKGNISPPKEYSKWADLVSEFTTHCISRYGLEEVRSWYFEVWNEPDLRAFWDGTKSEYFQLYKVTVQALKAIDKNLRVGGPATSNFVPDGRFDGEVEDKSKHLTHTVKDLNTLKWQGVWIRDFIAFCEKEKLPVDFISTHPYPTDWALDPANGHSGGRVREVDATKKDIIWLRNSIAKSNYPNAEIHLTEWSSSPSPRDPQHDYLQAAAYLIKVNLDCIGLTNSLSYWTFTDIFEEGGAGNSIFHGGFGMINYQGIVKPAYHGYRMLNQLGNEILHKEDGLIVTRDSKTLKIIAILYNYPSEMKNAIGGDPEEVLKTGTSRRFKIELFNLMFASSFEIETLDQNNGFAYPLWVKMGKPEPPTLSQTEELKKAGFGLKMEKVQANKDRTLFFDQKLQPWTCIVIKQL